MNKRKDYLNIEKEKKDLINGLNAILRINNPDEEIQIKKQQINSEIQKKEGELKRLEVDEGGFQLAVDQSLVSKHTIENFNVLKDLVSKGKDNLNSKDKRQIATIGYNLAKNRPKWTNFNTVIGTKMNIENTKFNFPGIERNDMIIFDSTDTKDIIQLKYDERVKKWVSDGIQRKKISVGVNIGTGKIVHYEW